MYNTHYGFLLIFDRIIQKFVHNNNNNLYLYDTSKTEVYKVLNKQCEWDADK